MNGDLARANYSFICAIVLIAFVIYFFESVVLFYICLAFSMLFLFISVIFFTKFKEEKKELKS